MNDITGHLKQLQATGGRGPRANVRRSRRHHDPDGEVLWRQVVRCYAWPRLVLAGVRQQVRVRRPRHSLALVVATAGRDGADASAVRHASLQRGAGEKIKRRSKSFDYLSNMCRLLSLIAAAAPVRSLTHNIYKLVVAGRGKELAVMGEGERFGAIIQPVIRPDDCQVVKAPQADHAVGATGGKVLVAGVKPQALHLAVVAGYPRQHLHTVSKAVPWLSDVNAALVRLNGTPLPGAPKQQPRRRPRYLVHFIQHQHGVSKQPRLARVDGAAARVDEKHLIVVGPRSDDVPLRVPRQIQKRGLCGDGLLQSPRLRIPEFDAFVRPGGDKEEWIDGAPTYDVHAVFWTHGVADVDARFRLQWRRGKNEERAPS